MRHTRDSLLRGARLMLLAGAWLAGGDDAHAADVSPRLGLNMATLGFSAEALVLHFDQLLTGEIQLDNQAVFGMAAGADVAWKLGSHVFIGTGASVSMQGGSLRGDELLRVGAAPNVQVRTIVEFDYELIYLNVPVTLRLNRSWAAGSAYVATGPQLGVLLHDEVTQSTRTTAVDLAFDPIPPPDVPSSMLSVFAAAGFEVPLRRGRGFLEFVYTQGLTTAVTATVPAESVRQRVLSMTTGIRY